MRVMQAKGKQERGSRREEETRAETFGKLCSNCLESIKKIKVFEGEKKLIHRSIQSRADLRAVL